MVNSQPDDVGLVSSKNGPCGVTPRSISSSGWLWGTSRHPTFMEPAVNAGSFTKGLNRSHAPEFHGGVIPLGIGLYAAWIDESIIVPYSPTNNSNERGGGKGQILDVLRIGSQPLTPSFLVYFILLTSTRSSGGRLVICASRRVPSRVPFYSQLTSSPQSHHTSRSHNAIPADERARGGNA